ncbi:MAG TPA: phytanoyl-CoA dioxygenase family protein [Candidatus Baltobacteraceae bacterium]|nr:phytanoyl-CoA dioxygenase family protein [Candidatus Baltobacteraceae bacterium]
MTAIDFALNGFAGPFTAFSHSQARTFCDEAYRLLGTTGPDPRSPAQSRHLDSELVRTMCLTPAIIERVRGILGPSIVLWRSNFFPKAAGAGIFDWHRDRDHWTTMLDPMINVSAWLALEPATRENGCVEIRTLPAPESRDIAMELAPGEYFLFDQDTVHRSGTNVTAHGRMALAIRFTLPGVRIDRARLFPSYEAIEVTP